MLFFSTRKLIKKDAYSRIHFVKPNSLVQKFYKFGSEESFCFRISHIHFFPSNLDD